MLNCPKCYEEKLGKKWDKGVPEQELGGLNFNLGD